jgi:hypothetical protein
MFGWTGWDLMCDDDQGIFIISALLETMEFPKMTEKNNIKLISWSIQKLVVRLEHTLHGFGVPRKRYNAGDQWWLLFILHSLRDGVCKVLSIGSCMAGALSNIIIIIITIIIITIFFLVILGFESCLLGRDSTAWAMSPTLRIMILLW